MGNTTRVSLLIIVISDLLTIYSFLYKKKIIKSIILVTLTLTTFLYASILYDSISFYVYNSNTLFSRFDIWNSVLNSLGSGLGVAQFLFGIDVSLLLTGVVAFSGGFLSSIENQFIAIFLFSGIVGLGIYLTVFIIFPIKRAFTITGIESFYLKFLAFSIFLLSLTLDNITHYASFVLIILIYYYCLAKPDTELSIKSEQIKNLKLW